MNKKTACLGMALCACLAAPLSVYAYDDKGADTGAKRESVGEAISDAAITTKVKAAILGDRMLKVMQIKVKTTEGVVRLTGKVKTQEAVEHAAEVAQKVKGVVSVDNQLEVKSPMSKGSEMKKGSEMNKGSQ
ncbi:MAG: BON domain-containing protein [Sulfuricella sp.]|nr:BON domain-containing protein [Sulfuricella sp.]